MEPVPVSLFICMFPFFTQLLDYVMTALLFSDRNVDSNLITWNRVVLLHGKACEVTCDKVDCDVRFYLYLCPSGRSCSSFVLVEPELS